MCPVATNRTSTGVVGSTESPIIYTLAGIRKPAGPPRVAALKKDLKARVHGLCDTMPIGLFAILAALWAFHGIRIVMLRREITATMMLPEGSKILDGLGLVQLDMVARYLRWVAGGRKGRGPDLQDLVDIKMPGNVLLALAQWLSYPPPQAGAPAPESKKAPTGAIDIVVMA